MIDFKAVSSKCKDELESYLFSRSVRGCDYSFANLLAWEHHEYSVVHGMLILRYLGGEGCYLFPSGNGDAVAALTEMYRDAHEREVKFRIKSMTADEARIVEGIFGKKVRIKAARDSFDYVYLTESLAELKGKHYHGKRGHYAKFRNEFPHYTVNRISRHSVPRITDFLDRWYEQRDADSLYLERRAVANMLSNLDELGAEGLILQNGADILAFTVGSRSTPDTFDVHFEKASSEVPAAYTAIATEFAKHVRSKYPEAVYLNREDDMGIEGLRRAKESWYPHSMIEKYVAEEI